MDEEYGQDTILTHAGCDPQGNHGIVNPPVYHASTVLFPTLAALEASRRPDYPGLTYGRHGSPTTHAFEDAVATLERGHKAVATSSGLNAIAIAVTAFTKAGGHILVTDSAYGPVRSLCNGLLERFGVETEYYDPRIGAGIARLIRPDTTLVYLESPGSLSFEMQDVPASAEVARAAGVRVLIDNTWATPYYFKPFAHGADVSIHAATKYLVGHSDAMLGLVVCRDERTYGKVRQTAKHLGTHAAPDDVYLGLRGMRTLAVRLARHYETGMTLARWLQGRPEVARVLHPALPDDPGHAIWRRDFTGASGLFGVVLRPVPKAALAAMLDGLRLFGMGYSWGGFESLILPSDIRAIRTAVDWVEPGSLLRLHAGLEDPADLIRDLEQGFDRLRRAAAGK